MTDDRRQVRTGLPQDPLRRSLKLAALPLGHVGRSAFGLARRLAGGAEEAVRTQVQERTARQLFQVVGELKGGTQKLAQVLSVMEAAVPEHLAAPYRSALTELQEAGPPLPAAVVHRVLRGELGPGWRALVREFDDRPVACASIGQVHRARWRDGTEVAVKVQHPGAERALNADLGQLRRLGRLFAPFADGLPVEELVHEVRDRMVEELDYGREAGTQRAFAASFAGDEDFLVPPVVHGTGRVLVTGWLEGTPVSAVIADGTREQRDRLGLLLVRFLFAGPQRCGLLHSDPHPGNFRLLPDGRLGVLDFGAVTRLPDGLPGWIGGVTRACADGDPDGMAEVLRRYGLLRPGVAHRDFGWLYRAMAPMAAPLAEEEFAFDRPWMREVMRTATLTKESAAVRSHVRMPPEQALVQRVWLGTLAVLCQLGARVPIRAEALKGLPGFDARTGISSVTGSHSRDSR
ncbi:ABC1 kinase family protein [Streptomyces sp. NRRL WC-3742]|uniref:ABC1 kinase family protein n=1 Tax=Streptomyces sp. NRRL WC-3742 TaxID=1463934 RepID=UPI000691D9AC|nr:AarF/ABC1/UbiB kinase family protein [Streptomyces sp. NRRL WC-3742]